MKHCKTCNQSWPDHKSWYNHQCRFYTPGTKARDLDALVAEKVFVHKVVLSGKRTLSIGEPDYYDSYGELILHNPVPEYSTDITAAWEVVDNLKGEGWEMLVSQVGNKDDSLATAYFMKSKVSISESAPTVPLALCLAAIKVINREEQENDNRTYEMDEVTYGTKSTTKLGDLTPGKGKVLTYVRIDRDILLAIKQDAKKHGRKYRTHLNIALRKLFKPKRSPR